MGRNGLSELAKEFAVATLVTTVAHRLLAPAQGVPGRDADVRAKVLATLARMSGDPGDQQAGAAVLLRRYHERLRGASRSYKRSQPYVAGDAERLADFLAGLFRSLMANASTGTERSSWLQSEIEADAASELQRRRYLASGDSAVRAAFQWLASLTDEEFDETVEFLLGGAVPPVIGRLGTAMQSAKSKQPSLVEIGAQVKTIDRSLAAGLRYVRRWLERRGVR